MLEPGHQVARQTILQREKLGGFLPKRRTEFETLEIPGLDDKMFASQTKGSGDREVSTTMSFGGPPQ